MKYYFCPLGCAYSLAKHLVITTKRIKKFAVVLGIHIKICRANELCIYVRYMIRVRSI